MSPRLKKRTFFAVILVILGYCLVRITTHEFVYSSTVRGTPAVKVWEYVSDFSNMKKLIPNMISFQIESENGGYENWKYRVYYDEYVAQLPFLTNFAWADYETKKLSESKYVIYSTHRTCFGSASFCLHSTATFEVEDSKNTPDCHYTETIRYQCPFLFKVMCEREVRNQREHMNEILHQVFTNTS